VPHPTRKQIEQALTEWGEQYRATVRMDAVARERAKQQMLRALAEKTGELHEGGRVMDTDDWFTIIFWFMAIVYLTVAIIIGQCLAGVVLGL